MMIVCDPVFIENDCVLEEEESFSIHIGRTSDLDRRIKVDPGVGAVTIIDNDGIVKTLPSHLQHLIIYMPYGSILQVS